MHCIMIKRALLFSVLSSTFAFADYSCEIGSPSGVIQETVAIKSDSKSFKKNIDGLELSIRSGSLPNGLQELQVKITDPVSGNIADSFTENIDMDLALKRKTDSYATRISCSPLNN